ncbi:uncharacterized protein I303_104573 [Kwoniella dejecticola CBS 10117]|uniref:Uncharacterized protein n=1 Tax=Kwoniella dejecticola CBS 10117 TaxID=1296121 RepID=A0A1A6A4X8_9TREE|nr:uncharacterized protein I303_04450 [Kwoniella dejecticola CBS 10117]OBR85119.1 hypothetical protein I303_04450 [Kwoniella dejecticola CBS 10117]
MSRSTPKATYQPDPNGWINTGPSASSASAKRRLTQRPLVSFSHGIATPLSSGYKKSSTPRNATANANAQSGPGPSSAANLRKRLHDQTPTIKNKQGDLNAFLHTPSSIGPARHKGKNSQQGKEGIRRTPLGQKDSSRPYDASATGGLAIGHQRKEGSSPIKMRSPLKGSRLKVYRDDFWGSSDNDPLDGEAENELIRTKETFGRDEANQGNRQEETPSQRQRRPHMKENNNADTSRKTPNKRKRSQVEAAVQQSQIIPSSLPPPARSTRSHDKPPSIPPSAAERTRLHEKFPSSSPSLPELTSSITPEPETEPTHPRETSASPGLFDPVPEETPARPAEPYTSPPPPITPVPDYVLYNHRQINHRNPSQFAAIPSPWRKKDRIAPPNDRHDGTDLPLAGTDKADRPIRNRLRQATSKRDEVDRRVWTAAHENRHKTPPPAAGAPEKRLVDLSSSDPPSEPALDIEDNLAIKLPSEPRKQLESTPAKKRKTTDESAARKALTPIKVNRPAKIAKTPRLNQVSPGRSPLTPRRRKVQTLHSPLPRTSVMQRERSISPSPVKTNSKAFPNLSGRSPSSENQPQSLSEPDTPQKAATKKYHQITPPKSTRPRMAERQETLFVLPDPPRQPSFPRDRDEKSKAEYREWKPAEMDPETLLFWGLEPADAEDEPQQEDPPEGTPEKEELSGDESPREPSPSPESPLFSPAASPIHQGDRRPSLGHRWSSKSIEPTAFSQDFPRLLPSSPSQNERSSSPSPPQTAQRARLAKDVDGPKTARPPIKGKWDHLQRGILATPASTSTSTSPANLGTRTPGSKPSSQRKGKGRSRATDEGEQVKLAAYGFFNDRAPKRLKRDFENRWEDEADIDVPEDKYSEREQAAASENGREKEKQGKKMGKVPEAPYHPSLRPAGIRELERRRKEQVEGMKRKALIPSSDDDEPPLFGIDTEGNHYQNHNQSLSTSNTSSSQTSSSKTPGSTKDWWDNLCQRRASEFGTME